MQDLWNLLLKAQVSKNGIPEELILKDEQDKRD
jgi:hypothetical protein